MEYNRVPLSDENLKRLVEKDPCEGCPYFQDDCCTIEPNLPCPDLEEDDAG